MADPINPSHYEGAGGWQSIDVIEAFVPDKPHRWAALKYIFRAGKKDPAKEVEDLRKAIWWLEREISHLEPKPADTKPWQGFVAPAPPSTGFMPRRPDCQDEAVWKVERTTLAGVPSDKRPCACAIIDCFLERTGCLADDAFCRKAENADKTAEPYGKAWTPWSV